MTSKNFNKVMLAIVNKLNKSYHYNFDRPVTMMTCDVWESTNLCNHTVLLAIEDGYLYIKIDLESMYEINLDNEVANRNELYERLEYLLALAYTDVYNGVYDTTESTETTETTESTETTETTESTETAKTVDPVKEKLNRMYGRLSEFEPIPTIYHIHSDPCFCCEADRKGNRCGGKDFCARTKKRYWIMVNPEWHHVSLKAISDIEFCELDAKRISYLKFYKYYRIVKAKAVYMNPWKTSEWETIVELYRHNNISVTAYTMAYENIFDKYEYSRG